MHRVIPFGGAVLATAVAALVLAGGALASTTYHGKFVGGSGYSTQYVFQPLDYNGNWNVNLGSNGTQITGSLFVTHAACKDSPPPCQFNLPLSYVNWSDATWSGGVLTTHGTAGSLNGVFFQFTFTLDPAAVVPATLHVDITGCPYGWQYWDFAGDLST